MESEIMIETTSEIPIKAISAPSTNTSNPDTTSTSNNNLSGINSSGSWTPDVFNILFSLSSWLRGIETKQFDQEEYKEKEKELWKDWEWVLSTTEEFVMKQNQIETEKVLGELNVLKKTANNLKLKPVFINKAVEVLKTQSSDDMEILKSSLDSNKRSAVITTVINTMESEWLNYIKEKFFKDELCNNINNIPSINSSSNNSFNNNDNSSKDLLQIQQFENDLIVEDLHDGWEDKDKENEMNLINQLNQIESLPLPPPPLPYNESEEEIKELKLDQTTFDMIVLNKNINKITWNQFLDGFRGQKYSKGINARMKDIGFQASHGFDGSLNSRVMGDITWSIWNTLNTALKQIRELTAEESDELVEKVSLLQPILLRLWLNTKINSRVGVKNEGLVVEKWKLEDNLKKKKILDLKKSGKLDRYTGEKTIVLAHEKREIQSLRSTLEKHLKLRTTNTNNS